MGKPSMATITSCGKSSFIKDVSYSSSLQTDKGGQLAASSDRQFRFSREPREEVATLQKCSNREARKGIPIAGEKLECVSPKTFVWKLQADDLHVIRGKQMHVLLLVRGVPSESFVVVTGDRAEWMCPFPQVSCSLAHHGQHHSPLTQYHSHVFTDIYYSACTAGFSPCTQPT